MNPAKQQPKLKPCPFYGGEPTLYEWTNIIQCRIKECLAQPRIYGTLVTPAIEAWNTRKEPKDA